MPIATTKDNLALNEYLVKKRQFLKLALPDVAQKTGIPYKYLKKIENGDWEGLPSGVYAKGFLKKYAQLVGIDEAEVAFRYKQEYCSVAPMAPECAPVKEKSPTVNFKKIWPGGFFSKLYLRKALFITGAALLLGYIFWQLGVIWQHPKLSLNYPLESAVVSVSNLEVRGRVVGAGTKSLTVNNEPIYADGGGDFKKEIELLPGVNVLEIKAVSRFGKETKITRRVTYNP